VKKEVKKEVLFRWWFYLRQGYTVYFAFLFIGLNTLVVTYYLAIEKAPFLKEIFPTFIIYVAVLMAVGVPLLVFTGFLHYKKMPAFKTEAEVTTETNPYLYKLPPGYWAEVIIPFNLITSKILVKLSNKEELSDELLQELNEIQKKMEHLMKGGYVGSKTRKLAFDLDEKT